MYYGVQNTGTLHTKIISGSCYVHWTCNYSHALKGCFVPVTADYSLKRPVGVAKLLAIRLCGPSRAYILWISPDSLIT